MKTSDSVIATLVAAGFLLSATGCAPTYAARGGQNRTFQDDHQRRAYANGQTQGLKDGRQDAQKGRRFQYDQHESYRDADKGFGRRDGDREDYRESFRKGFVLGYSDAYQANERDKDRQSKRR
jgi:hypothetical protein